MGVAIGKRYKSNMCGWYTVVDKTPHPKGTRWTIEFDESFGVKYQMKTDKRRVLNGGVRNPYYPLKLGIACVGGVNSKDFPKEFNKWRAMIERCYDQKNSHYSSYGGRGVKVCDRWLCFEYFLEDLKGLEGYDLNKIQNGELELDKDIEGTGRLYSPENCVLVSPLQNTQERHKRTNTDRFKAINILEGNIIIADTQNELANIIGTTQSAIAHCIRGQQKSTVGYKIERIKLEEFSTYEN